MNQAMPDNPFLSGAFAPIDTEYDVDSLPITGEIPADLNGSFYRIGPNQQFPPRGDYHLFAGDGMTHAFHIADGKVAWQSVSDEASYITAEVITVDGGNLSSRLVIWLPPA